jgi:hypothetical protein
VLELLGNVAEHVAAHRVHVTASAKESDHAFGLLKRLNEPIEQEAVKTPIPETDAILMMLVEGVHGFLQGCERS